MKTNGYGSYVQNIVINVKLSQVSEMSEALKTEPTSINTVMGYASFTVSLTSIRKLDDETVVYKLGHILPTGINWRVDWNKSEY